MRTLVVFRSDAFNTSQPGEHYLNPGSYGDDVARWRREELARRGYPSRRPPDQEDFGWYSTFRVGGIDHDFVVGFRPGPAGSDGEWIGWVERRYGLIGSLLGRRRRGVVPEATAAIHAALVGSRRIRDVRWHDPGAFGAGRENDGAPEP
jgi:hypothetical protein